LSNTDRLSTQLQNLKACPQRAGAPTERSLDAAQWHNNQKETPDDHEKGNSEEERKTEGPNLTHLSRNKISWALLKPAPVLVILEICTTFLLSYR